MRCQAWYGGDRRNLHRDRTDPGLLVTVPGSLQPAATVAWVEQPSDLRIRDAVSQTDIAAISSLYNALIDTSTIAWTEHRETLATRQDWFAEQQSQGYPVLVAESDGDVVGYASFGDFRDAIKWPGYRFVVEHTVHIREDQWGRGVGRALMAELIRRARQLGKTQMVGGVDGANDASIQFHERLGFVEVARMPQIGFKFDQWLDLVLLQRSTANNIE
jgi:L-amino acid N-acyltransferase